MLYIILLLFINKRSFFRNSLLKNNFQIVFLFFAVSYDMVIDKYVMIDDRYDMMK